MPKTIKALPLFIALPVLCFFVEPVRVIFEQLFLLSPCKGRNKALTKFILDIKKCISMGLQGVIYQYQKN